MAVEKGDFWKNREAYLQDLEVSLQSVKRNSGRLTSNAL